MDQLPPEFERLPVHQLFLVAQAQRQDELSDGPMSSANDSISYNTETQINECNTTPSTVHTSLAALPNELILEILRYLSLESLISTSRTSHRLRSLSLDTSLWTRIAFHKNKLSTEELKNVVGSVMTLILPRVGTHITTVELNGLGDLITDSELLRVGKYCPNLMHVNIGSLDKITESGIESLSKYCPLLEKLIMSNCRALNDKSLHCVAASFSKLKVLDISAFTLSSKVSDLGLLAVIRGCSELETLVLVGSHMISDESIIAIATSLKNSIKHLDIQGCFLITDEGLMRLLNDCNKLEYLDLSYCWRVTDAAFQSCFNTNINRLSVQFCYQLTDSTAVHVAENFTKLSYANMAYCCNLTVEGKAALERRQITSCFDGCKLILESEVVTTGVITNLDGS